MFTQDTLTQVQQSILQERTRRGYAVIVTDPRRAIAVAGVPVPEGLEIYDAETSCTEIHEGGNICRWVDYVFLINGEMCVMLWTDLGQPWMLLDDSVRLLLAEMSEEQKWSDLFHSTRGQHILDTLITEARREIAAGETKEGGFGDEV